MRRLLTLAALAAPFPALAHGGADHVHGIMAGLAHPLGGLDHVAAMLAVGLWAGLMGGRAMLALPAAFLGAMALGGALGMGGLGLPMVEAGILASVIVLGALVAGAARVSLATALPLVAAFGLLHGLGFGSVMKVYLENADLSAGLIGITIGVEAGHLSVLLATGLVASAIQLALKSASKPQLYRAAFVIPVAAVIALVGLYWTLQRVGVLPE